jgi:hypothetical protein
MAASWTFSPRVFILELPNRLAELAGGQAQPPLWMKRAVRVSGLGGNSGRG